MSRQSKPKLHTAAWTFQVWAAFAAAMALSFIGVWHLPATGPDAALLAMGFLFCLSAAFTLAKTLRDNQTQRVDTAAWIFQSYASFGIAACMTGWSFFRLTVDYWHSAYMFVCWVFLMSSAFGLAKTLRDNHEATQALLSKDAEA
jgi:hypothetical protein